MAKRAASKSRVYVDGNTVRKVSPVRTRPAKQSRSRAAAEERRIRAMRRLEKQYQEQQARLRGKSVAIDGGYLAALVVAMAATLVFCFVYLKQQTEINTHISSIEKKSTALEKLKTENDALKSSIDTSVDLNEIYRVATQELGMVYADEDQVVTYSKTESGYVRQYEDIPQN